MNSNEIKSMIGQMIIVGIRATNDSDVNKFYREYFSCLLSYSAMSIPEIADEYYQLDDELTFTEYAG